MPCIQTADLLVAYQDGGDPAAAAVLLLHWWPDETSARDGVTPELAAAGRRAADPVRRQRTARLAHRPLTFSS